ncbi:hypothetical protein [Pseudoalteromonas sp. Of7M-16]|uniref:hypothetical protein n=1 Tax=Pseudoalteromonas sp. Of7M-16 TaxID=2917756 RepID=UPI001EF69F87|nr:hypothetical protein [Pseudoalteromonas sp. Of7M-16]MCG7551608.1 hypothetical protein [Pseudoalteromonas sp. Of7M-16]
MELKIPNMHEQKRIVYKKSTQQAIDILTLNLDAPVLPSQEEIDEGQHSNKHLLRKHEGWEAPHPDIVGAYFRHFQGHFQEYNTDKKLAQLLEVSSDRRIRDFKQGVRKVPYDIWRRFLVLTGRAPQDVLKVMAFLG